MKSCEGALIALGGNMPSFVGTPEATLQAALKDLRERGVRVDAVSRFYHTPCFPAGAGPDYVNAAAQVSHDGPPQDLLTLLHQVEAIYGRDRVQRWGQRTLDLDLLAVGDLVLPDLAGFHAWHALPAEDQKMRAPDDLILPHPRLQDRAFVLVPLADVAPGWRHPVLGLNVSEMCAALSPEDVTAVRPLT